MCCSGIYYEQNKEPPLEGPPKLHLLVESNEEFRVSHLKLHLDLLLIPLIGGAGRSGDQTSSH